MDRRYKDELDRDRAMLLPPRVDDYVSADNLVRAIDVVVDSLELAKLGFQHAHARMQRLRPAGVGPTGTVKALPAQLPDAPAQQPFDRA